MIILVADTSILIDLERGALLATALAGPDTIATPDLLYEQELLGYGGPDMVDQGLRILELSPAEMATTQTIHTAERLQLSLSDCAAYVCACRQDHALLTGDQRLRRYSETHDAVCHGLLWLLDRRHDMGTADPIALHDGLVRITDDPRCRRPRHEVQQRLKRWRPTG